MNRIAVTALALTMSLGGVSIALAQQTDGGTNSQTPERGAGVNGVGPSAEGRSANQPGSSMQPNSTATPGPSTQGTPGNMPAGTTR